jgi:hypothetical protein
MGSRYPRLCHGLQEVQLYDPLQNGHRRPRNIKVAMRRIPGLQIHISYACGKTIQYMARLMGTEKKEKKKLEKVEDQKRIDYG